MVAATPVLLGNKKALSAYPYKYRPKLFPKAVQEN